MYRNGRTALHMRQLQTLEKRAKQHMRLSGLKPCDMARWASQNLIEWLNRDQSRAVQRVLAIIDLAQQAQRIAEEARRASGDDEYFSCKRRLVPLLSELNAVLRQYRCVAKLLFYDASLHRHYQFGATRKGRGEVVAVAFLIENLTLVHRLRRCLQCQNWFFAVTEHQKYCGDDCRKRHAAHGEDFLEKRRIYMRRYRQDQKAADKRAKSLTGRK